MATPRPLLSCLVLALALPLAACTGTPFGEQLSDSFSAPPSGEQPGASGPAAPIPGQRPQASTSIPSARNAAPAASGTPPSAAPPPNPPVPGPAALPPAPYRLILRLPAADPAAPAEAVTEALRAAGVSFEVETIERVPAANAPSESVPAPAAPVPAPLPAPTARPAPAPR
jgi:hypothetical protein